MATKIIKSKKTKTNPSLERKLKPTDWMSKYLYPYRDSNKGLYLDTHAGNTGGPNPNNM